jgi:hypothetical protein
VTRCSDNPITRRCSDNPAIHSTSGTVPYYPFVVINKKNQNKSKSDKESQVRLEDILSPSIRAQAVFMQGRRACPNDFMRRDPLLMGFFL